MSRPLVSALVLTRDRPDSLHRCLQSLCDNGYRPLEVIVVDNGSPETQEQNRRWIEQHQGELTYHYEAIEPSGFAAMRRVAYELASGQYIVSIDDDCEAHPQLVQHVVEHFERVPQVGMIGGQIENVGFDDDGALKGRGKLGLNGCYEPVEALAEAELFGSANQSVRREAYDAVGGYDLYFADGMEEADLVLSLRSAGWEIVYDPQVQVRHFHLPQRFRSRWRNLHRMRLYLYFKHLHHDAKPGTFWKNERTLMSRELGALWGGRPRGRPVRALLWAILEAGKIICTRAMVPFIRRQAAS